MSDLQPGLQDDLLNSLLSDFLDESDQLLVQLNENLLQLDEWVQSLGGDHDQRCDEDLLNEMFRAAHSLKGLSAMLGLSDINNLTHKIENVFDAARKDDLSVNGDVVDLVFMGLDQLTALVDLLKEPGGEPVDCNAVLEGIHRLLQSAGVERKQTTQADAEQALATELQDADANADAKSMDDGAADAGGADPAPEPDPLENLKDETDISDKYVSIFVDETELSLDDLEQNLTQANEEELY